MDNLLRMLDFLLAMGCSPDKAAQKDGQNELIKPAKLGEDEQDIELR